MTWSVATPICVAPLSSICSTSADADDGAERAVRSLMETAQPVKMAKQLVRAVDNVNDHAPLCRGAWPPRVGGALRVRACTRRSSSWTIQNGPNALRPLAPGSATRELSGDTPRQHSVTR